MRIVILSTESVHHIYFINYLAALFRIEAVFYETQAVHFPYDVASPFAAEEKGFEEKHFSTEFSAKLGEDIPTHRIDTVNSAEFTQQVQSYRPDLGLVFGCGRIKPHVFRSFKKGLINVHRGVSSLYRGLDSDLWAIYHQDFENIGVTLHYVAESLDTGDILAMRRISYGAADKIYHLRYKTTLMAAEMVASVASDLAEGNEQRTEQKRLGRYYSAMPAVLKPLCVKKFTRYIEDNFNGKSSPER